MKKLKDKTPHCAKCEEVKNDPAFKSFEKLTFSMSKDLKEDKTTPEEMRETVGALFKAMVDRNLITVEKTKDVFYHLLKE